MRNNLDIREEENDPVIAKWKTSLRRISEIGWELTWLIVKLCIMAWMIIIMAKFALETLSR
jgi:hypothetical protein